eukprot:TRINITY_DN34416_c0_g1_i1.p1 TRINITY_DN34416_c0_g1~~TRINITY_DN34416_c0_g1_i1.p1  ORF type:complete len:157 (+),score=38.77 TRINITY_DN34416_c0_g1_i1:189-659(+)
MANKKVLFVVLALAAALAESAAPVTLDQAQINLAAAQRAQSNAHEAAERAQALVAKGLSTAAKKLDAARQQYATAKIAASRAVSAGVPESLAAHVRDSANEMLIKAADGVKAAEIALERAKLPIEEPMESVLDAATRLVQDWERKVQATSGGGGGK